MARAVYQHELNDPDFEWLLRSYREKTPHARVVEPDGLPVVILTEPCRPVGTDAPVESVPSAEPDGVPVAAPARDTAGAADT